MELTGAGEKLLELATDILSRVDRAEEVMRALFMGRPAYTVACLDTTAHFIIAPFIAETSAPIVDVRTVTPNDVYTALDKNVDLAVSTHAPPRERSVLELVDIPITAQFAQVPDWARNRHALELELLTNQRIVMPGFGSAVEDVVVGASSLLGVSLDLAHITGTGTIAQALAAAGVGAQWSRNPRASGYIRFLCSRWETL
ncbi:hypothetical protein RBB84_19535 [Rhodococcus sp. D-6]|uniref:Uncharacterized protein n=1 Tax=Rhodococcus sp. D-6 TaxID=1387842 RepID=A0AAU7UTI6_9NOCA